MEIALHRRGSSTVVDIVGLTLKRNKNLVDLYTGSGSWNDPSSIIDCLAISFGFDNLSTLEAQSRKG